VVVVTVTVGRNIGCRGLESGSEWVTESKPDWGLSWTGCVLRSVVLDWTTVMTVRRWALTLVRV